MPKAVATKTPATPAPGNHRLGHHPRRTDYPALLDAAGKAVATFALNATRDNIEGNLAAAGFTLHDDDTVTGTQARSPAPDCDREDLYTNWNARPARRRGTKAQASEVFRRIADECSALELNIVRTRATTVDGARAKLAMVISHSSFDADDFPPGGTMLRLPISAMQAALALLR